MQYSPTQEWTTNRIQSYLIFTVLQFNQTHTRIKNFQDQSLEIDF
jgi:hypothetical protein